MLEYIRSTAFKRPPHAVVMTKRQYRKSLTKKAKASQSKLNALVEKYS